MKFRHLISCMTALTLTGCGGSGSTQQATSGAPPVARQDPTPIVSGPAAPSQGTSVAPQSPVAENIPAGARFTLFCARIEGAGNIERAIALKKQLVAQTGMIDWHMQHTADGTLLYHGYYRSIDINDRDLSLQADAQRAERDRTTVENFRDPSGNRVFARAIFTPIEQPDPDAPPEWNLKNVEAKWFWTVQESAYTDPSVRKQQAVLRVKDIRAAGLEAFYFHGEGVSSVCVGLWPQNAVENADVGKAKVPDAKENERDYKLVVDTIGLPADKLRQIAGDQGNVGIARAVKTIKDATLIQTTRDFPHFTNYEPDMVRVERNGKFEFVPRPGMVVQIPRQHLAPANAPDVNGNQPDLRAIDPDAANRLDRRLRGISQ
jgi:hypothetical protein